LKWTRDGATGAWSCSTSVEKKYRPAGCSADLGTKEDEGSDS